MAEVEYAEFAADAVGWGAVSRAVMACLTRNQAAVKLGVSATRVDQLRREGVLESVETPLGHVFTPTAVQALIDERSQQ